MATKPQKMKVGLFLIICFGMIGATFAYLANYYENPGVHYTIEFNESILGLYDGAIVTYLGVTVGKVRSISVTPRNTAVVDIIIDPNKVVLMEGVEAQLTLYSFASGTMAVSLTGFREGGRPLPEGSRIPTRPSTITAISEQTEDLVANLNAISDTIRVGLEGMGEGDLDAILKKIDTALENANAILEDGKGIAGDVQSVVANVRDRIDGVVNEFEGLSADLRSLARNADEFVVVAKEKVAQFDVDTTQVNVNRVLDNIAEIAEKVDGTLADLNNITANALHQADNVEFNLRRATGEVVEAFGALQALVEQLRQDPSSIVRGKGTVKEPRP